MEPGTAEKLRRIKISGFRSIRDLNLTVGDLTVLVGANGSGKSNFISFFHMLNNLVSERLERYIGTKGGGSSILHYGPKLTPQLDAELEFVQEGSIIKYEFTLEFAAPDRMVFARESISSYISRQRRHESLFGVGQLESRLTMRSSQPLTLDGNRNDDAYIARFFVEKLKSIQVYHFHDTSDRAPVRILQDINGNRGLTADASNLAAFLYMLQETRMQHFNRIVSTIKLAVPYFNNFILEPDRLSENPRILLRWQDRRLDYEFGPHQLSDGSLRAIALITLLLQPKEMLPSVILLDEPELGLHPSAVGLIGSLIKSVSVDRQVIVATQSPRLLAEFAPEDVVVVEREEDKTGAGESVFKRLSAADLGDWLNEYDLGTLYEMNVTGGGPQ